MKNVYKSYGLALLATSTLGMIGLITPAVAQEAESIQTPDTESTSTHRELDKVVVTAQRRESTILETPVAVSAVSGDTMGERSLDTISDLTSMLPGVQFGQNSTNTYITIRGIGNGTSLQGADPGVAFHLDGVYLSATGLAGGNFMDVERIEVLRGPQGTLFGRNATGGAINVVSSRPTEDFEAEMGLSVGADPMQMHLDGFLSGSLTKDNSVLGRLSLRSDYNEGYTENGAAAGPERLDDENRYSVRGQLEFRPTESLTVGFAVDHAQEDANGQAIFLLGAPAVDVNGNTFFRTPEEVVALDAALLGLPGGTAGDIDDRLAQATFGIRTGEFTNLRVSADWATDYGSLKLLAAHTFVDAYTDQDGDGADIYFSNTQFDEQSTQDYFEAVWSSTIGNSIDYLIGANHLEWNSNELVMVPVPHFPAVVIQPSELDTTSYAFFTHADWHVTDKWDVFGGVRYTHDKKHLVEANNFVGAADQEDTWQRITYEFGSSYEIASQVNVYAKYATGFKAGGFAAASLAPPFNEELNDSIEVGVKGLFFEDRLDVALAVFDMSYDDLQVNQVIGASAVITNAAKASIQGAEIEVKALVTDDLQLELAASILDATFDDYLTQDSARPTLGPLQLKGNYLPWSPESTFSLGAYYTLPVNISGELTLGGRYYWKDTVYFSEFNLPVIAAQEAVGRSDITLNYESDSGAWFAGVFVRNLSDEVVLNRTRVVSSILNSSALGTIDPGREVGIQLRRRF